MANIDYHLLNQQLEALIAGETNALGQLSNATALLAGASGWHWVGFYLVNGDNLELGPFQGPVACYTIPRSRGVCGSSWSRECTLVVPDVEQFEGHIACSSLSKSEIVVPIWQRNRIIGVLDIDSVNLGDFNESDKEGLEEFCRILSKHIDFRRANTVGDNVD